MFVRWVPVTTTPGTRRGAQAAEEYLEAGCRVAKMIPHLGAD